MALARILLAKNQPTVAQQRLHCPVLHKGNKAGQRWGLVIEVCLLQALAHQKLNEEPQALAALSEAVRLGEPQGYIQSFVDEGVAMVGFLSKLREQQRQTGPTAYPGYPACCFPQAVPSRATSTQVCQRAHSGGITASSSQ